MIWGVSSSFFLKIKLRYTISISLFYVLILHIIDCIVLAVMGVITHQLNYVDIVSQTGIQRMIFILTDKIFFVCLYLIMKERIKDKVEIWSQNKHLLFISLGGLCGAFYLTVQMSKQVNMDIAVSWIFLLIVVALMLINFYFYIEKQQEKNSYEFVAMRNELLEKNYNNLKELYEKNSKLFHDFKNHIRVINRLVNENNLEELREYITGFKLMDCSSDDTIWTENTAVNFILNNKIALARQEGIQVDANIEFPLKTNLKSNDMTTIIANLFDNAIESCNRIPDREKKKIDIIIRRVNAILIIKFENSCYQKPVKKEGIFLSIKSNKDFHGWGLKSVESTVKKYRGALDCSYSQDNHIFTTVLNLSFKEMEDLKSN